MSNVKELTDTDFPNALGSTVPVLIDFSATWCQPCKLLAPTIDAVAEEYTGRLDVYKVDIEQAPDATSTYGVRGVPTVVFFKEGQEVDRFSGALDLRTVKERVEKVLA